MGAQTAVRLAHHRRDPQETAQPRRLVDPEAYDFRFAALPAALW